MGKKELPGLFGFVRKWRNHITWVLKIDVWLLEGREKHSGKELSIAYAGLEAHKNYFTRIAFEEGWKEVYLERKWLWQIRACVRRQSPECMFFIYEINKDKERFFLSSNLLQSPVWIRVELSLAAFPPSSSVRFKYKDMHRRIRKYGLTYSVSKNETDFDDFYYNMYVAHAKKRHAESSVLQDYGSAKKKFMSDCELTLIHKDGKTIAGGIVDYSESNYHFLCMGIRDGSEEYLKMGASEALYYFALMQMQKKGGAVANLGHCRSFFNDNVFQYKLALGAHAAKGHHQISGCLRLHFLRNTEGLREFLCQNPFIALDKDKVYRGVFFTKDTLSVDNVDQMLKTRHCEKLRDVTVYTFGDGKAASAQTASGCRVRFLPASSVLPVAE